jgi:hypothetical protein
VKGGDQNSALILEMSSLHANLFFDARQPIDGLVESNSLPAEAQQKLADRYPGPDVGNSLILSVGKKPSSPDFGWCFVAVGVALILPLCGLIFWVVLK